MDSDRSANLAALRERLRALEGRSTTFDQSAAAAAAVPAKPLRLGLDDIDRVLLPMGGGLARGALHEILSANRRTVPDSAFCPRFLDSSPPRKAGCSGVASARPSSTPACRMSPV
jgi:hypothetical protein